MLLPRAPPKYFRFRSVYNVVLLPSRFWNLLRRPMKPLDIAVDIAVDGALRADLAMNFRKSWQEIRKGK
jgi:hypothetical protein